MFRTAFSANGFRKRTLVQAMETLAAIGYEGIEIMADIPHAYPPHLEEKDIRDIRSALSQNGLVVSNINGFMMHAVGDTWHPSWIETDEMLRMKRVEHTLNCIDLAEKLGAPSISTEPGGPLANMDPKAAKGIFLEGLDMVAKHAENRGVRVLIEPEPALLVENSVQFLDLFRELDPEIFGLNFDIGHFFCVGEDPVKLVRELAPCTAHYHLEDIAYTKEHFHLIPGTGAIDLFGVLDEIHASSFEGFVTTELYTYEENPEGAARQAFEFLHGWRKRRAV